MSQAFVVREHVTTVITSMFDVSTAVAAFPAGAARGDEAANST